ncbi:uncharacterized protein METZ01_LOCUS44445 [marine metagenome]|uniref:Uncharacterized protein n=1 Tax=marine metagenome TaxID=408172 RepID=A0A381RJT6_9ZZZZ
MAGRFGVLEHPALDGFNPSPKYMSIYGCENEGVLTTLRLGGSMCPDARAELDR